MSSPLSPENQQRLAELTRKSLAKLLDQAHRTAELLADLERQAAGRRHDVDEGDLIVNDEQYEAALDVPRAIEYAQAAFDRADPGLFCSHGDRDKGTCAEGGHDR